MSAQILVITPDNTAYSMNTSKICFLLIEVINAADFGYFRFKSFYWNLFVKILLLLHSTVFGATCVIYIVNNNNHIGLWYLLFVIDHVIIVLILLMSDSENTYFSLEQSLRVLDEKLSVKTSSFKIEVKMILVILFNLLYKSTVATIFCSYCSLFCLPSLYVQQLFHLHMSSIDAPLLITVFVFYSINCRFKCLVKYIESDGNVSVGLSMYKHLIECTEKIRVTFDRLYAVSLVILIPLGLYFIYIVISVETKLNLLTVQFLLQWLMVLQQFLILFSPVFAVEALRTQYNKLRVIFYDKLIENKDTQYRDIELFLRYMEARSFELRVYNVIPFNATLPVIVLNVSLTYLIVVIQLTHVF